MEELLRNSACSCPSRISGSKIYTDTASDTLSTPCAKSENIIEFS